MPMINDCLARCEFRPYETTNFHFRRDVRALSSSGARAFFRSMASGRPRDLLIIGKVTIDDRGMHPARPIAGTNHFSLSLSFSLPMEGWFLLASVGRNDS